MGVEAKTGKLLWRYDRTAKGSPAVIPTPVADGDFIYSAGARSGGGGVRLKVNGGTFEAEQVYYSPKLPTSVGGAVKVGDYLYGTSAGALLCLEFKTGNVKWDDRSISPASLCYADGRLYLHGENGEVALVEATPGGLPREGPVQAHGPAGSRRVKGLGLSGHRQRAALYPRYRDALVLRCQSATNDPNLS